MPDKSMSRALTVPKEENLAVRTDARIAKAEHEYEAAKCELETVAALAAQAKMDFDELRRLTGAIKNLAPLIRDEVNLLERLWHHAEEQKGKLTDSVEVANKELKSVYLAREQLKQIGMYFPLEALLSPTLDVGVLQSAGNG